LSPASIDGDRGGDFFSPWGWGWAVIPRRGIPRCHPYDSLWRPRLSWRSFRTRSPSLKSRRRTFRAW
jgi:hypothetical protein